MSELNSCRGHRQRPLECAGAQGDGCGLAKLAANKLLHPACAFRHDAASPSKAGFLPPLPPQQIPSPAGGHIPQNDSSGTASSCAKQQGGQPLTQHALRFMQKLTSSANPISSRRSASSSTSSCRSSSPTDCVLRKWSISLPCTRAADPETQQRVLRGVQGQRPVTAVSEEAVAHTNMQSGGLPLQAQSACSCPKSWHPQAVMAMSSVRCCSSGGSCDLADRQVR